MVKLTLILCFVALGVFAQVTRTPAFRGAARARASAASGGFTLIGISTNATTSATRTYHNTNSVPAGALLVLSCANENDSTGTANATLSDNQSLSWTKAVDASAVNSGNAEIWTAVTASGGTVNVTNSFGGATVSQSSTLYYFTGQEGTLAGTNKTQTAASQPSVTVLSTRAASYLIMVSSDFNAIDDTLTFRDVSAVLAMKHLDVGSYTAWHYYRLTTTVTDYTEGMSSPAGQAAGTALYEIRPP